MLYLKGISIYDSALWTLSWQGGLAAEQLPPLDGLPTLAETMKDAASFPGPVEALQWVISEDEETRLY